MSVFIISLFLYLCLYSVIVYCKSVNKPPWGLFAKMDFWVSAYSRGGVIQRGAGLILKFCIFLKVWHFPQSLAFSSKFDIEK